MNRNQASEPGGCLPKSGRAPELRPLANWFNHPNWFNKLLRARARACPPLNARAHEQPCRWVTRPHRHTPRAGRRPPAGTTPPPIFLLAWFTERWHMFGVETIRTTIPSAYLSHRVGFHAEDASSLLVRTGPSGPQGVPVMSTSPSSARTAGGSCSRRFGTAWARRASRDPTPYFSPCVFPERCYMFGMGKTNQAMKPNINDLHAALLRTDEAVAYAKAIQEQARIALQLACTHNLVAEYRSHSCAPFKVCLRCGFAEKGWGCGYKILTATRLYEESLYEAWPLMRMPDGPVENGVFVRGQATSGLSREAFIRRQYERVVRGERGDE